MEETERSRAGPEDSQAVGRRARGKLCARERRRVAFSCAVMCAERRRLRSSASRGASGSREGLDCPYICVKWSDKVFGGMIRESPDFERV